MKRLIATLITLLTLTLIFGTCIASASFGSGVEVIASNTSIIKSGLYGKKLTFSDTDFKQGLCITDFKSITITKIPSSTEGTLMLAGRRIGEGTTIKRKNISAMVFIPATNEVSKATFKFTVEDQADQNEIEFIIRFTDKVNYEPEITEEVSESLSLKTQRDIGIYGQMKAIDRENDEIEYIIVSYPKDGSIKISNTKSGEYVYTPTDDFTGEDSFSYVARDEWGNYSTLCKVNISVSERMCETVYEDMQDRPEYNAAVTMTAMGVMGGKVIGDGTYFSPNATVSRAEFVAMAMKVLGVKADTSLTKSYFDDNSSIPEALVGYVATAQRVGIVQGSFSQGKLLFRPNDAITKYEAGVVMANLLGAKADGDLPVFSDASSIPAWARPSVYAMCSLGIFESDNEMINGAKEITRGECATYLYKLLEI